MRNPLASRGFFPRVMHLRIDLASCSLGNLYNLSRRARENKYVTYELYELWIWTWFIHTSNYDYCVRFFFFFSYSRRNFRPRRIGAFSPIQPPCIGCYISIHKFASCFFFFFFLTILTKHANSHTCSSRKRQRSVHSSGTDVVGARSAEDCAFAKNISRIPGIGNCKLAAVSTASSRRSGCAAASPRQVSLRKKKIELKLPSFGVPNSYSYLIRK